MSARELVRLSCVSSLCFVLQRGLGEQDCRSVAALLLKTMDTSPNVTAFITAIHALDDEFPAPLLEEAWQCVDAMRAWSNPPETTTTDVTRNVLKEVDMTPNVRKRDLEGVVDDSMPVTEEMMFETTQFAKASGVHPTETREVVDFNADMVEVDVKIKQELPHFLRNEGRVRTAAASVRATHVVCVVKDPKGSLALAIENQQRLFKDKRELREADRRVGGLDDEATFQRERDLVHVNSTDGFRNQDKAIQEQRRLLKIHDLKKEFLAAVAKNDVLVVIGETGSGKTTQMTQYLAEAGYGKIKGKIIGCTQPRRLPARSVAERVAKEYGCKVGEQVGFTVRFEDMTSSKTVIKYMTDGILLREALGDPTFSKYSVVIIDEAHERNINTDVLIGLLKRAARSGDFKLIVTSATLNVEKFARFFGNCDVFSIPGRTHPVQLIYNEAPAEEYIYETVTRVMKIHLEEHAGDVLVFMPGKEEIEDAGDRLTKWAQTLPRDFPGLAIHMIYATMPT